MKQKISLIVMTLILIVPVALYAIFKTPQDSVAIAATGKPTVVEFTSPLCSECQKLTKVFDKVKSKYSSKITFTKVNTARMDRKVMKNIEKYDIKVVPTLIFLDKDGNTVSKTEGSMPEEMLCDYLDRLIQ